MLTLALAAALAAVELLPTRSYQEAEIEIVNDEICSALRGDERHMDVRVCFGALNSHT